MMSPSVKPLKIFCICGTGIAGATVVITSLKEIFADIDVPAIYELGSSMNIRHMMTVEMPDMIVHTSKLPEDFGMPCFSAIPFYTGKGEKELIEEIKSSAKEIWAKRTA